MNTKKIYLFAVLLALLFQVNAQQMDSIQRITLNEVVVSAQRQATNEHKLTQQVLVVPQARIELMNAPTTAEILTETGAAGVQKSQQGGGSPSLRGFEASRVLLYVDNIPMNNLIYRAGHLQNMITIDPSMLRNLEVLYGPASVTYGSDALGGVIHFYTKNPTLNEEGKLNGMFRTASANWEKTAHFDFDFGFKKWAFLTSASFSDFGDLVGGKSKNPFMKNDDGYIHRNSYVVRENNKDVVKTNDNDALQIGSGYSQLDVMQKILFKPSDRFQHLLNVQYSTSTNIPRYDRLTELTNNKPTYAEWYYGPQKRAMAAYDFNGYQFMGADKAGLTIAYQDIEESRNSRKLNKKGLKTQVERVKMLTLNSFWKKGFGHQQLTLGVDGALNFLKSTASTLDIVKNTVDYTTATRYPGGNNHMHHIDFYTLYANDISEKMQLTAGARAGYSALYAQFTDKTYYTFLQDELKQNNFTYSGSLGLSYLPTETWKLAANISGGFRVPNIDDLTKVFDSTSGTVIIPNPNIQPEKTVGIDLTIEKDMEGIFRWANHIYGIYLIDGITLGAATLNGNDSIMFDGTKSKVQSSQNFGKGYVYGFSSKIDWKISKNLASDAAVSYQYGQIVSPTAMPLDHVAPLYGRVGLSFLTDNKKNFAELFSVFNGQKPLDRYNPNGEDNLNYATVKGVNGNGIPAWFTLNARYTYKFASDVSLQLGVNNILDTEYRAFASGINAPGRSVYATFRFGIR